MYYLFLQERSLVNNSIKIVFMRFVLCRKENFASFSVFWFITLLIKKGVARYSFIALKPRLTLSLAIRFCITTMEKYICVQFPH